MPAFDYKNINFKKIYSPSKISCFYKCPKQYHFSYVDPVYSKMKNQLNKYPENIWPFNTIGRAIHNAITLFYHLPKDQRTEENLKEQLKMTWTSEAMWNKKPPLEKWGGFESLQEEREYYKESVLMLKNFLKIAEVSPDFKYLPTDNFKKSIDDYINLITPISKDYDISGKFDLIVNEGNSLHIIDFKTGKNEEGADDFQLRFYKLLAEEKFSKPVGKTSFYFLRSGSIKESRSKKEDSEKIKKEILEKINEIKSTKDFVPLPSGLCKFCLYKTFCPKKQEVSQRIKNIRKEDYPNDLPF